MEKNYFKIKGWLIGLDLLIWTIASLLCVMWRWVADKSMVWSYMALFGVMCLVWCVVGFLCGKYKSLSSTRFLFQILSLLATIAITHLLTYLMLEYVIGLFSSRVAVSLIWLVATMDLGVLLSHNVWMYAQDMDDKPMIFEERKEAHVLNKPQILSAHALQSVLDGIKEYANDEVLYMLRDKANLDSSNTRVIANRDLFTLQTLEQYRFDTIVNLALVNDLREINKHFAIANDKLPDGGRYICCFRPKEVVKEKILKHYPAGLNWIVYLFHFIFKRMMPKLVLTSHLYFDLTDGKNRVLTETEVLGRLYFCGFEVDEVVEVAKMKYVFARRVAMPQPQSKSRKRYGPLIRLPRVGKNKKIIYFYKMRSMHPYSEYIQKYVYDKYGSLDGDKAENDFRITTWGRFFRKVWIDELPMIINLLRGDMKLVGVRPLSKVKFDSYPKYLQDKRTLSKPGLIPPFYVDMPKTQEEMYDSEERYIDQYLKHPLATDFKYFWKAFYMIVFKRARSH